MGAGIILYGMSATENMAKESMIALEINSEK